jgi:hypothetical protein
LNKIKIEGDRVRFKPIAPYLGDQAETRVRKQMLKMKHEERSELSEDKQATSKLLRDESDLVATIK